MKKRWAIKMASIFDQTEIKQKVSKSTTKKAVLFMILCTFFISAGQVLLKLGLFKIDLNQIFTLFNLPFLLGFIAYGLGFVLMLLAFKSGELSILYPILASSYVWVSLAVPYFFPNDFMNAWKWAGVILILVSVALLGYSQTRKNGTETKNGKEETEKEKEIVPERRGSQQ